MSKKIVISILLFFGLVLVPYADQIIRPNSFYNKLLNLSSKSPIVYWKYEFDSTTGILVAPSHAMYRLLSVPNIPDPFNEILIYWKIMFGCCAIRADKQTRDNYYVNDNISIDSLLTSSALSGSKLIINGDLLGYRNELSYHYLMIGADVFQDSETGIYVVNLD